MRPGGAILRIRNVVERRVEIAWVCGILVASCDVVLLLVALFSTLELLIPPQGTSELLATLT